MTRKPCGLLLFFSLILPFSLSAQAAGINDGENLSYYETLGEALISASEMMSAIDSPVEITLLKDIVLDEPFVVPDGVHIRLVAENMNRTIRRGNSLIAYPVIWVRGESSSLSLGKPGMEHELFIDGGYLNDTPILAECPLVSVCGPGSKLIMYDNVSLQNNYNAGNGLHTSFYELGAGVFIRTEGDVAERTAEFIMKGGTIRGNKNFVQHYMACGGGLLIAAFGIFTMEGGIFMDNTAQFNGGGVHVGGRGTFRKTGGIIYGSNAPLGLRNTGLNGTDFPRTFPVTYGHSVSVAVSEGFWYRNDTVNEDDNLTFTSRTPRREVNYTAADFFGIGEKWETSVRAFRKMLLIIIVSFLAVIIPVFIIFRRIYLKKRFKKIAGEYNKPQIDYEGLGFTNREKEICELLLTTLSMNKIADTLKLTYSGVNFHTKNLYTKLGIHSRTELFVKLGSRNEE
jgi:DNA-binding CsgD family transcriptional regulator